jgi:hypothetical protein
MTGKMAYCGDTDMASGNALEKYNEKKMCADYAKCVTENYASIIGTAI